MQQPPEQPPPVQEEPAEAAATPVGSALGAALTELIGPGGGSIESADGTLRIDVPPGALAAEHALSIQSITNHAHGQIGGAFRLAPEGVTFTRPVRLTFQFTPQQILNTAPQFLRIASQNADGFWESHESVTLDADAGTIAVDVHHFSDWSLVSGTLLAPQSAIVRPGESVPLAVVVCERVSANDLIAPLIATCRSSAVIANLVRNWSVNGVAGGDSNVGTITVQENGSAVYTAPATAPQRNPVAVSAEFTTLQGELVMLVANIQVQSGLCTPAAPAEPCRFDLVEFNGEGLPYSKLPRETWENPEQVTAGRLSLWDTNGDGAGTWSLRHVWVEVKPAGDLEQFMQLAGDFSSTPNGGLQFSVVSGETFTGRVEQNAVTLEGYPLTTKNVTVSAQLKFTPGQ